VKPDPSLSGQEANDAAYSSYCDGLVPCEYCGRTFLPDRLEVHYKSCGKNGTSTVPSSMGRSPMGRSPSPVGRSRSPGRTMRKSKPTGGAARPQLPTCYICGRQFGSQSLAIHEKSCIKKWENEDAQLDEHLRRPRPVKPDPSLSGQEANDAAYSSYCDGLVPCEYCGRTFLPDRLEVHYRSCGKNGSATQPHKKSSPQGPTISSARSSFNNQSGKPQVGRVSFDKFQSVMF